MRTRWTVEEAAQWESPWLLGCNFTPSSAANQLEMWQAATFDLDAIDRELGWAASIGMNSVRVFLHNLVWSDEGDAHLDRIDTVLARCESHGISMMPVLFDGVWHPNPRLGAQPPPKPGLHNSVWVQGPGAEMLYDETTWPELQRYVEAVVGRFGRDDRIVVWDLFNEPSQQDRQTLMDPTLLPTKQAAVDRLVRSTFQWARSVDPQQPLTVGLFGELGNESDTAAVLNATALELSDVISFHSYDDAVGLERWIDAMAGEGRPVLCTEWLARSEGSTVELLEILASRNVAAYNWGLVDGKTQTKFPWSSWWEPVPDATPWFHELFHPDGEPYDDAEVALFRRVAGKMRNIR